MDTRNRSVLQLGLACLAFAGRSRTSHKTPPPSAISAVPGGQYRHKITAILATASLATAALTGILSAGPAFADQARQTVATGLTKAAGTLVDPDGRLWVSDSRAGFCRVTETSGSTAGGIETGTCLGGTLPGHGSGPALPGTPAMIDPTPANHGDGDEIAFIPDAAVGSSDVVRALWNPDGGVFEYHGALTIFDGDLRPNAVSDGPDGNIYLSFANARSIVKMVDPTALHPSIESIASVNSSSLSLAATHRNSAGNVVVYVAETSGLTVFTAPDDGVLTNFVPAPLYNVGKPTAIYYDWQSPLVLYTGTGGGTTTADAGKDTISRIDLSTDTVDNQWALGFSKIGGLAMRDGKVLVMEDPGQLDPAKPAERGRMLTLGGVVPSIVSGPTAANGTQAANPAFTNDSTPTFAVASTPPGGALECSLQLSSATPVWQVCSGGTFTPTTALANGGYTFSVRAAPSGLPVSRAFTIDTTAPTTPVITSPAAGATVNGSPVLGVTSDPDSTLACSVDSPTTFTACTNGQVIALTTAGQHVLRVRATDMAGNVSALASVTVTADLTAPQVSITAPAEGATVGISPSFTFTSSSTDIAGFRCKLGSNAYTACTSPKAYTNVPSGPVTFSVEARDNAGNVTTAARNVTVFAPDTAPPVVTVDPVGGTYAANKSVALSVNEAATIYVTTDGTTPTTSSPVYSGPIPLTSMTLKYFARDTAGNSSAVSTQTYVLDNIAPVLTVNPVAGGYASGQLVTMSSSEAGSIFYTTDGTTPATAAAGSTKAYAAPFALTANTTVKAIAVDAYGNASPIITRAYTVLDTTPPVVTVTPPAGSYPTNQQITLTVNEPGSSIYFTTNGTNPTATAANKYSAAITLTAAMTLKYFAVDPSNNSSAIVTQAYTVTAPPANTWKDYTGDAKNDVVARDNGGTLWLYPGNGSGGWLTQRSLGTGWNSLNAIVPTKDFNGDGRSDILARDTSGILWLYPGNGAGGLQTRIQAGTGWAGMTLILAPGDFSGDGKADVLARDSAGILWLYRGNGTGGFTSSAQVGTGWNSMTAILSTGDFNGDSKTDVLARDTSGILWLYPGNGTGGWLTRVQVGSGWTGMTAILGPGDFNGDGKNDVLARDAGGNLFLYPGNGTSGWLSRSQVGWGWGGFTSLP
ncbi:Repeat domain-containing protein [Arthrobacter sp. yr096]|uniref:chitobiase/beta-hexosaminidase C-terminal domain-containing protein n=1 Tax=Arthrobacter sp. yr096 TaxID=1761750 RepID=UPI0008D69CB6|nr:chitobiase/beta-hexosaminidase C-terminal domain-containing protein [Arthrobacter sp. yr096]SEI53092.1 Repeat domain-containing protein [Arthrobacter sp. yr096]